MSEPEQGRPCARALRGAGVVGGRGETADGLPRRGALAGAGEPRTGGRRARGGGGVGRVARVRGGGGGGEGWRGGAGHRRVRALFYRRGASARGGGGGVVEKFIGDAVMAVFGVPQVHEDDALRAVRAAAELRAALEALNAELERDYATSLSVRIGVNTGEVVTGTEERLATGDAVNVAARLEQAAQPGRDPRSARTRLGSFEMRSLSRPSLRSTRKENRSPCPRTVCSRWTRKRRRSSAGETSPWSAETAS